MTRGQIIAISPEMEYYRTCEFNGDMYVENGHGEEIIEMMKSHEILDMESWKKFVRDFDDRNFQYVKNDGYDDVFDIVDLTTDSDDWSFWYTDTTNLFDLTTYGSLSDYMYWFNLSDEDIEVACQNGVAMIPAGECAVFNYRKFYPVEGLGAHLLDPYDISESFPERQAIVYAEERLGLTDEEAAEIAEQYDASKIERFNVVFDSFEELGENEADAIGIEDWMKQYFNFEDFGRDTYNNRADEFYLLSSGRIVG